MAHMVTVEGTVTPCAGVLRRGERRTVTVTPELRKWVRRGCVKVVEGSLDPPPEFASGGVISGPVQSPDSIPVVLSPGYVAPNEPEQVVPNEEIDDGPPTVAWSPFAVAAPPRNASRKEWAEFLDNHEPDPIDYPPDAGRDDLIDIWDEHQRNRGDGLD